MMKKKVLFVDDEQIVLEGYKRTLRKRFDITVATGGREALKLMESEGPFAAVVSDMTMPEMSGTEFLLQAKQLAPDTVRLMLTGNADQKTAVSAINDGDVYSFINKPCPPSEMQEILQRACEHYYVQIAEKKLLEDTLKGSICTLTEVLSLNNPEAFGRTNRIRHYMIKMSNALKLANHWEMESIAMLSLIGYISLPSELISKVMGGDPLTEDEKPLLSRHPEAGAKLIANIPRMEGVAKSIRYQEQNYNGSGVPGDGVKGEEIPLGARILKIILDYDRCEPLGLEVEVKISQLKNDESNYDPNLLKEFIKIVEEENALKVVQIGVMEAISGLVLAADVKSKSGAMMLCKGQRISETASQRLLNFYRTGTIGPNISVYENYE